MKTQNLVVDTNSFVLPLFSQLTTKRSYIINNTIASKPEYKVTSGYSLCFVIRQHKFSFVSTC